MNRLEKFSELFDAHFERVPSDYERFAKILSGLAGRDRPWQKSFVYNILIKANGFSVGDQMWDALLAFEKEKELAIKHHAIMSIHKISRFAVALSGSDECAWEECPEHFIKDHPSRTYHSDRCRMDAKNKRRRLLNRDK